MEFVADHVPTGDLWWSGNWWITTIPVGARLAREEAGTSNINLRWKTAIAGKPCSYGFSVDHGICGWPRSNVGVSLLAMAVGQSLQC